MPLPDPFVRLIEELQRLPGVGPKGAQRLAFFLLKTPREQTDRLVDAISDVKAHITYARVQQHYRTPIRRVLPERVPRSSHSASSKSRRTSAIIEKTREFKGVYHVLMGALSPLQGIGPDDLRISGLLARISNGVSEVILATNPNVEGEATAIYLARLLKPLGVRVTRIAMGVPVGSDLDYADEVTMHKALEGRREV